MVVSGRWRTMEPDCGLCVVIVTKRVMEHRNTVAGCCLLELGAVQMTVVSWVLPVLQITNGLRGLWE